MSQHTVCCDVFKIMLLRVVHEAGVEVRLICLIVVGIRNIVYSAVQTEQHTAHAQAPDVRYPRRHKLRAFRLVREYPASSPSMYCIHLGISTAMP